MATIAHLANFYGPRSGGLRTSINALSREYALRGHDVHVIVPGHCANTMEREGVTTHSIRGSIVPLSGGYRVIRNADSVIDLLQRISPDAVELSDRTTLLPVADWARAHGIPVALIAHERVDGVIRAFSRLIPARVIADRLNRRTADRVDSVVCTTDFASEEFDRIDVPVTCVPLGVDLDTFHPRNRSDRLHDSFGAKALLILCSRLSREKRTDFAIEVLDACIERGLDAHLVIAGDGPLRKEWEKAARGRAITMLGFVSNREEMARMLASADVLLAPGPIETFGLAALEALASGTPAIVNATSALPEVIGDCGGIAAPLKARAWAEAIELLVNRGPRGRRDARHRAEQFPWDRTARQLLALHRADAIRQARGA